LSIVLPVVGVEVLGAMGVGQVYAAYGFASASYATIESEYLDVVECCCMCMSSPVVLSCPKVFRVQLDEARVSPTPPMTNDQ